MASKPGVWSEWPWQYFLGLGGKTSTTTNNKNKNKIDDGDNINDNNNGFFNSKLLMYVPFLAVVVSGNDDDDSWCYHMLLIVLLRYTIAQFFITVSRIHALTRRTRIQSSGINYQQIDREDSWDDYMILQAYTATAVHKLPWLKYNNFPVVDTKGLWLCLLWHVSAAEFLYYWLHRLLHHHVLYSKYHSHHHQCKCFIISNS